MPRRPSPKVAALVKSLSDPSRELESLVAAVGGSVDGGDVPNEAPGENDTQARTATARGRTRPLRTWSSVPVCSTHSNDDSPSATPEEVPNTESLPPGGNPPANPAPAQQQQGSSSSPERRRSRRRLSGGVTRSPPGRSRFAAEARPVWADPEVALPQLVKAEPAGVAGALAEAAQAVVDAGTVGQRVEQGAQGWRTPGGSWKEMLRA